MVFSLKHIQIRIARWSAGSWLLAAAIPALFPASWSMVRLLSVKALRAVSTLSDLAPVSASRLATVLFLSLSSVPRRVTLFSALLPLLLLLPSCTDETEPGCRSHTVIFYLGGNNNLSASIASQVSELQAGYTAAAAYASASSRMSANVFVYAALSLGASLMQLSVSAPSRIIDGFGQTDSADPATLARVIEVCRRAAPADTYSLVVASHATGWLPAGALQNPQPPQSGTIQSPLPLFSGRSIIRDEGSPTGEMELDAFAAAIPDGVFDAIVLEACLMGGAEVAYALRDKARYLLAAPAELLDPGFTPIYRNALRTLCNTNSDTPSRLIAFAGQYMAHIDRLSGDNRSATLSVIDLGQMEPLAEAFARCCEGGFPVATQQQLAPVQHFDRPGRYGDRPALARFFDLENAVRRLVGDAPADELTRALGRAVIWKASTATFMPSLGGFTIESYCGLTTYIPQTEFPTLNDAYRATLWWRRTSGDDNP